MQQTQKEHKGQGKTPANLPQSSQEMAVTAVILLLCIAGARGFKKGGEGGAACKLVKTACYNLDAGSLFLPPFSFFLKQLMEYMMEGLCLKM